MFSAFLPHNILFSLLPLEITIFRPEKLHTHQRGLEIQTPPQLSMATRPRNFQFQEIFLIISNSTSVHIHEMKISVEMTVHRLCTENL